MTDLALLHRQMRERGVRIRDKSVTWHQVLADVVLRVLTLGFMTSYLTRYVTTIGSTIYVPRAWGSWPARQRYDILRHELVHVAQFERWGVLLAIAYVLWPLPIGLAYFRMRIERAAYEESIRCAWARGGRVATDALRAHVIEQFVGPAYLWMWPFRRSMERWYDVFVESLER